MQISYINRVELADKFSQQAALSLDFVILITGALPESDETMRSYLSEAERVLKKDGILLVQGKPSDLPALGVLLEQTLTFKYWFAVESTPLKTSGLPSVHAAIMMFTKGNRQFKIKQTRLPHQYCTACERTLKDWGGKSHLMNPNGYVISDVIKDIPAADNYEQLSKPLFDILTNLLDFQPKPKKQTTNTLVETAPPKQHGWVAPQEGLAWKNETVIAETKEQYTLPGFPTVVTNAKQPPTTDNIDPQKLFNLIHEGDSLDILKQYPDESIDLVFADPPYNLDKAYTTYEDGQADQAYLEWCEAWLAEYARILKPTGALFLLNLPRWAIHQANFLNQRLHFQNWIVWDALSEPRGKIMPAHYALLFYTKHRTNFTFNYEAVSPIEARHYCLRASCIRHRKKQGDDDTSPLNDIWWDVHRIKHRRDRDYHPCQLPDSLMARIIKLSTNPGDVVLDAFGGAGTTPTVALKLKRQYVAMDLDPSYVQIMRTKIAQIKADGQITRQPVKQAPRQISKKALQLELRQLSVDLGRLPTPEDVKRNSQYELDLFLETFSTWGKALKAAKLEFQN